MPAASADDRGLSSAGNTRGLIEAHAAFHSADPRSKSSAGNTRGLIEACRTARGGANRWRRLPRGIPAASLKRDYQADLVDRLRKSSAGNTRGLIEARGPELMALMDQAVFRGEYPRPH